jgi:hypothetical protein
VNQAERQTIEGYLAHKWGLAGNLPAAHPHKAAAPGAPSAVATLNGSASDPENDPLTHSWSVVSGPGPVVFSDASILNPDAAFTVEGVYTLRLATRDGFGSSFADVVITVGGANPSTAFEIWAGGESVTFADDANRDGVADGMAWLMGAQDPADDANGLLPTVSQSNGALQANLTQLNQASRGAAVVTLEYSTDLGPWISVVIPEQSGIHGGVDFEITAHGDIHQVKATIPASVADGAGKVFMRLRGELPLATASR